MIADLLGLNLNAEPMSSEEIDQYRRISNFIALISLIYGILTILLILRYTTRSMLSYRFHLLNMSLTILLCDLSIATLTAPHTIFPAAGICMVGFMSPFLTRQFGVDPSFFISLGFTLFIICSSLAAVTNATIHRYMSITRLLEPLPQFLSPRNVKFIMIFLQFVSPLLMASFICLGNLHSDGAMEYNVNNHPEIVRRTANNSCLLLPNHFLYLFLNVLFLGPILVHGCLCIIISVYMLWLCWLKIFDLQQGKNVSKKTIELHKQMIISITIQTLAPNILVALSVILMAVGFVIKFEFIEVISGVLAFHFGSLHSVLNFLVVWWSIPAYRHGVFNDIKTIFDYLSCQNRRPGAPTLVKHFEKNTHSQFP